MQLQLNPEAIKEQAEALKDAADYFELSMYNHKWNEEISNPEKLLLGDYISKYKVEKSGCTEEEYKKCSRLGTEYSSIVDFYDNKAEEIRREISFGYTRPNIPYDVNLTKAEAFQKYCECDEEIARKAYDLMRKVDTAATYHEKELRENYQGDLFAQLGRENERPEYEERARLQQERIKKASEDFMKAFNSPENQERLKKGAEAIKKYMEFVKQTADNYEKQESVQEVNELQKEPVVATLPNPDPATGFDPERTEALRPYANYINEVAEKYKELNGEESGPKL